MTTLLWTLHGSSEVSIHTPTWGVTFLRLHLSYEVSFNPHTYMRCDMVFLKRSYNSLCFNPHTYMRCDHAYGVSYSDPYVSIHTPTWGVTRTTLFALGESWAFQSTHLHEVWQELSTGWLACPVSIHTPTWGVTRDFVGNFRQDLVSIHTPTWGVTFETFGMLLTLLFQSTHLHEVWPILIWILLLN